MRRSVFIAVLVVAGTLIAIAPGIVRISRAAAQQKNDASEVKIDNFSFGPTELTISAGSTVTWTNRDDIPHTVVSTDKLFKSKVLDTDDKFSFKFEKAGSYPYFCSIHPKMTGKVIVQ
jgi:plastocyanin